MGHPSLLGGSGRLASGRLENLDPLKLVTLQKLAEIFERLAVLFQREPNNLLGLVLYLNGNQGHGCYS
jgi:hypothetical protein